MFMLTINLEIKKTGHSGCTEKRMHVKLDQIDKSVTVIDLKPPSKCLICHLVANTAANQVTELFFCVKNK